VSIFLPFLTRLAQFYANNASNGPGSPGQTQMGDKK